MRNRNLQRIYEARRAGLVARLADTLGSDRAEALIAAWELDAKLRGVSRLSDEFWRQAENLIGGSIDIGRDALTSDGTAVSDPHLVQVRLNEEAREAFLAEFSTYSPADIARLRGSKTSSAQALTEQWLRDMAVFAIETPTERRFPAFQFDGSGVPRPTLAAVLRALPAGLSGWQIALWFTGNSGRLGGARPVDVLDSAPDHAVDAAAYLAATVNEE